MNNLQLHKAVLGLVNLSDLFSDIKMFRHIVTKYKGSYVDRPSEYLFVGGNNSVPPIGKKWYAMSGKPTAHTLWTANKFMCEGPVKSFNIIPWPKDNVALVTCTDRTMIPSCWVAFIPLDQVPDGLKLQKADSIETA